MAALSTKLFKVELADPSCFASRAARRVVINAEILRACKVAAGDVVRVTAFQNEPSVRVFLTSHSSCLLTNTFFLVRETKHLLQ